MTLFARSLRRDAARAAAALAAAALLAGCASTGSASPSATATGSTLATATLLEDPKSYEGPSTAVLADAAITAVVDDPTPQLPVTVSSHDPSGDTEVTVGSAERVLGIDIAGSIAATIAGLGMLDRLVGRDQSTAFPGTEDLPVVTGDGHAVNSESVIALRPDLVITDGTVGPTDVILQLRDAGIAVVYVDAEPSEQGAADLATQVAAALGVPDAGAALAADITSRTEAVVDQIAGIAPAEDADRLRMAFLYLRGAAGVYYLFGEGSGADVLIDDLGGIDVAAEIGWEGMKPMTDEALIAADPDLILVMTTGLESVGGIDGLLAAKPAIALTTAGENRRFVDMADGDILSFGPRLPEVLEALAVAVYAPAG
ncbi:MAG: ABC transporter substrate-binding protein [Microbacteriaceae bacterium]